MPDPNPQVRLVQEIVERFENQKLLAEKALSDYNRKKLEVEAALKESAAMVERTAKAVAQTRAQLTAELRKLDPDFFKAPLLIDPNAARLVPIAKQAQLSEQPAP